MSTSSAIRSELVEARKLDLVGADNHHAFGNELLPDAPSQWYLSGFLVPSEAPADQKTDETSSEEIVSGAVQRHARPDFKHLVAQAFLLAGAKPPVIIVLLGGVIDPQRAQLAAETGGPALHGREGIAGAVGRDG